MECNAPESAHEIWLDYDEPGEVTGGINNSFVTHTQLILRNITYGYIAVKVKFNDNYWDAASSHW